MKNGIRLSQLNNEQDGPNLDSNKDLRIDQVYSRFLPRRNRQRVWLDRKFFKMNQEQQELDAQKELQKLEKLEDEEKVEKINEIGVNKKNNIRSKNVATPKKDFLVNEPEKSSNKPKIEKMEDLQKIIRKKNCAEKKQKQMEKKLTFFATMLIFMDTKMGLAFFYQIFSAFQMDLIISAFANLRFLNTTSWFGVINLILSISIILAYLAIILIALLKHIKISEKINIEIIPIKKQTSIQDNKHFEDHNKEHEEEKEVENFNRKISKIDKIAKNANEKSILTSTLNSKIGNPTKSKLEIWIFLKKELNPKMTGLWRFYIEIQMAKELLIALFVIVFIEQPWVQIVFVTLIFTVMLVSIIIYKPFKDTIKNTFTAIIEGFYIVIFLLFLAMMIQGDKIKEETKYNFYGYSLISIFMTILVLFVLFASFNIFRDTKLFIQRCRWMKNKKALNSSKGNLQHKNGGENVFKESHQVENSKVNFLDGE